MTVFFCWSEPMTSLILNVCSHLRLYYLILISIVLEYFVSLHTFTANRDSYTLAVIK